MYSINKVSAVMMMWMMLLLKGLKRKKFMLVNMGAETNLVCTLKKETGDSEEAGEIGNSGDMVTGFTYRCWLQKYR